MDIHAVSEKSRDLQLCLSLCQRSAFFFMQLSVFMKLEGTVRPFSQHQIWLKLDRNHQKVQLQWVHIQTKVGYYFLLRSSLNS